MTNVRTAPLVFLLMSAVAHAATVPFFTNVRTTQPALVEALNTGIDGSPFLRGLVARLNQSDVIVHIVYDPRPVPGLAGHLAFAAATGGYRYVRISIAPELEGSELIAVIGHELQHAVEIAAAPSVVDQPSMAAFYASVGMRRGGAYPETFDTTDAVVAGRRVLLEMVEWQARSAGG